MNRTYRSQFAITYWIQIHGLLLLMLLPYVAWSSPVFQTNELFPLLQKYHGEHLNISANKQHVRYFKKQQQQLHKVFIKDGFLVNYLGEKLDPQLKKNPQRLGSLIYVMDQKGQLYYSFDHRYGRIHHSSLVAGKPVAAAGEMLVYEGMIYSISNQSGHYHPSGVAIQRMIQYFKQQKVSLVEVELFMVNGKGRLKQVTLEEVEAVRT